MTTESKITKNGRVLFNVLFGITIAPTIFLLRGELSIFGVLQIASIMAAYLFVIYFPKLIEFKFVYIACQLYGLILGLIAYFYSNLIVLIVIVILIMYLFFIGKFIEIAKVLSNQGNT